MSENIKNEALNYLKNHLYANLASINSNDPKQPHAATIAYVNDGFNLYFTTSIKTQKYANLEKNSKVAMTIDNDEPDWMKLTGLQIEGNVELVNEQQVPKVFGMYAEKFPIVKDISPNPDYRFLKIIPEKIWLIDYTKGFGHREYLEL